MTPANHEGLLQMVQQNDDKHDDAHGRLRRDLRELEHQLTAGFQSLREADGKLQAAIDKPLDPAKVMLAPRLVVAIVAGVLGVAGGMWATTSGLRSDVRDILTRMEAQSTAMDSQSRASEALGKLQEVQQAAIRQSIDEMKRRQELQQYEIQGLKEVILTGKSRTR